MAIFDTEGGQRVAINPAQIVRITVVEPDRTLISHDTISHSYGLNDDETLPVAQRQTSISNSSFFAPAFESSSRVPGKGQWEDGLARGDPVLDEPRIARLLGSPASSVRKLRIAVESTRQFVGVEARRHFKRSVKTDDGARLSPPSALDRGGAFLRAIDDAEPRILHPWPDQRFAVKHPR